MKQEDLFKTTKSVLLGMDYPAKHVDGALRVLAGEIDMSQNPLLTTKQVCRLLSISRTTFWRMDVPFVVAGKRKRYSLDAVMSALKDVEVSKITNPIRSTRMAEGLQPNNGQPGNSDINISHKKRSIQR